jgi:hypothetical protein
LLDRKPESYEEGVVMTSHWAPLPPHQGPSLQHMNLEGHTQTTAGPTLFPQLPTSLRRSTFLSWLLRPGLVPPAGCSQITLDSCAPGLLDFTAVEDMGCLVAFTHRFLCTCCPLPLYPHLILLTVWVSTLRLPP